MLGTQADYDSNNKYIIQFGFYYRLRTCNAATLSNMCTGLQIYTELKAKVTSESKFSVPVTSDSQEVTLALSQSTMNSSPGCKLF